jgi:hypothetical protein
MTLYTPQKNPRFSIFGKVVGNKINIQNLVASLYTNNEQAKKEIRKRIPFAISSKKNT